jgi:hypothetical protein
MSITLYDATVAGFLQTLGGLKGVLERGLAHCADCGIDPHELVETRIYQDMLPLRFQVISTHHHSIGALRGAQAGLAGPPKPMGELDYAGLQALVDQTLAELKSLTPDDVNALGGKDVVFQIGELKLPFTAQDFLLSFSVPNFHFHSATAYDILRMRGVPLGKRDYLGALRLKR